MIKVEKLDDVYVRVFGDASIEQELTDFFTYEYPGARFTPQYRARMWDGKVRLYDQLRKTLYVGLLHYVQEFCKRNEYELEIDAELRVQCDHDKSYIEGFVRSLNPSSRGESITVRDYQLDAIWNAISRERILLLSPTASGKSLIIYSLLRWFLAHDDKRAVIIVPTTSLVQQMYSDFADYSQYDDGFDVETMCHRIYAGRPKFAETERVIITTWQSIYKLQTPWFEQFGMVIGDEAHNFKAKSLTTILTKCKEAEYRFGTTGTLDGTQTHKLVLEGLFGPAYYVTTTKSLMDSGALSDLDINVLLMKYPEDVRKQWGKKKYPDEMDYIVRHEKRNNFISNLALDQDGNTLVLFQYVEKHGKPLYDQIKNKAHKRRKIFYVSGETGVDVREEVRRITEGEKNAIIVASLGTFSTGINIRNLHNIIFASPSKSQIKILQSIGRGLRKSEDGRATKLYDLADDISWKSFKNYTLTHAAERIKIYTKEKFKYKSLILKSFGK